MKRSVSGRDASTNCDGYRDGAMTYPVIMHPGIDPQVAAMTVAELDAAITALPGKKDALRKAFERLTACSPSPLPFTWEGLDAYISGLQSSISLRFRQLQVLEAARPARSLLAPKNNLDNGKARIHNDYTSDEEEWEEQVDEDHDVIQVAQDKIGNGWKQDEETGDKEEDVEEEEELETMDKIVNKTNDEVVREEGELEEAYEEQYTDMNEDEEVAKTASAVRSITSVQEQVDEDHEDMRVAQDKIGNGWKEDEETGDKEEDIEEEEELETMDNIVNETNDEEVREEGELEEAYEEQYTDTNEDEEVARTASAVQGYREDEACTEEQGAETANKVCSITSVQEEEVNRAPPGADKDLVAACASMNTTKLFKFMCSRVDSQIREEYPLAMRHAPDAAALVLGVIKLFIRTKNHRTKKLCLNCAALIQCVQSAPAPAADQPSSGTIEQAKRVAKDWKEMIDKPGSYGDVSVVASWALLWFLVSYNIASEFETMEIIRLFAAVPRKNKKIKTVELCKGLGLADRITDLIDYLIGNGQYLDAVHLAHVYDLMDKYPPHALLKGYLKKAKHTVVEIFRMNMACKSQNWVIAKEIDCLRVTQNVVKEHITDSSQCSIILTEIRKLIDEYAKRKRDLANASTFNWKQQRKQRNKKRKNEEELVQEKQQRRGRGPTAWTRKPGEKPE